MFFAAPGINDNRRYPRIKPQREPLGFKVVNQKHFRAAIDSLKDMIDKGIFGVDPVSWTLYKYLNEQPIDYNNWNNDIFDIPGNLVRIDDITIDIDSERDIPKLEEAIAYEKVRKGVKGMIRVLAEQTFNINDEMWNKLKDITRANAENNEKNRLYLGDTFLCDSHIANYLLNKEDKEGNPGINPADTRLVKVIEVIPEKEEIKEEKKPVEKTEKKERKPRAKKVK